MGFTEDQIIQIMPIVMEYAPILNAAKMLRLESDKRIAPSVQELAQTYIHRSMQTTDILLSRFKSISAIVDIGCGIGLDSFALPKKIKREAFDQDSGYVPFWIALSNVFRPGSIFHINSFYLWKQHQSYDPGTTILLANQPLSIDSDTSLERNIVRFAHEKGFNLAMVPFPRTSLEDDRAALSVYALALEEKKYGIEEHIIDGFSRQPLLIARRPN